MEYFVSPDGDDHDPGTECEPFCTIKRGLQGAAASPTSTLQPGDVLTLRAGTYVEAVMVRGLAGTPGQEITIRSFPGERAVIDSGFWQFRVTNNSQWVPATTVVDPPAHPGCQPPHPGDPPPRPDEWFSVQTFPDPVQPLRGAFLDEPYRRLITYSTLQDFRADNQTFDAIKVGSHDPRPGPWRVVEKGVVQEYTYPWVYMGPGLWFNPVTHRLHIRLTPTTNNVPGLEDYNGPTDPNELRLAISDVERMTLIVADSRHLVFTDLTVRFGGKDTIQVGNCQSISFDHVDVWASEGGVRFADSLTGVTFRNCRFDGGLPPWFFRGDRKNEYDCLLTKNGPLAHNKLGKATIDVLMHGTGVGQQGAEIDHCEFVNGHDLYLVASNTDFHHNWIDNLDDDGMLLDVQPGAGGHIHANVISRCLAAISMPVKVTADHWYIYRNLIDLREPTAGRRPRSVGDTNVWRYGAMFKSNEALAAPDGPYHLFHNTLLVYDQPRPVSYTHYNSNLSPHPRRSCNNIFVAVNPDPAADVPITFIPPPSLPRPTDGNLYHRIGAATAVPFKAAAYTFEGVEYSEQDFGTLDQLRHSALFEQSKTQYPPGYEASSRLADPRFLHLAADGTPDPQDDLRPAANSPAASAAAPLPPDLQRLDDGLQATPAAPAPAGCYELNSQPLQVGVDGRCRFPRVPAP
jgi:hypothetical protein